MAVTSIPGNMLADGTSAVDPSTAGWQAKLNCTMSLGSGGRNGDGCLLMTSVAAGEMQVQTAAAYNVTAGQVYFTFADASSSTQPERIGLQWLNSSYVQVGSITWSVATSAAMSGWHRVSVAGYAPVGATRARVILSSVTPSAAARLHYWENVYLGPPIRTTGNLLSFGVESGGELDLSGWAVESNCTLSRTVPAVTWPVDHYTSGGHQLTLTTAGAGNASALCVERPSVVPGTDYVAYCHLSPPTLAAATWIELRFYDAPGNQVQVSRGPLAASGTGWMRQYVSGIAPATAATCSVAVGIDGASAGQVLRAETVIATAVVGGRAGNVLPLSDMSFEQGVGAWTKTSGVATIVRSTPWSAFSFSLAYSLTVTSTTATTSVIRSGTYEVPGAGGLPWRAEVYAAVTAGGWTMTRSLRWFDSGGTLITTTSGGAATVPAGGAWWWLTNSYTAPAGAAKVQVEYTVAATATNSVLRLDWVAVWQDEPWISAEEHSDDAYITITMRDLVAGDLISLYRVTAGGERTLVRGSAGLIDQLAVISDLMVVEDYEAPLLTPLTYQAEVRDPDTGAITEYHNTGTVQLAHNDFNEVWLKDVAEPQRNLKVLAKTPPDWDRPIEQGEFRIKGRRNTVTLSDVRGGLAGEFVVATRSDEERAGMHWILNTGHTLFLQTAPGTGVEDMYVAVAAVGDGRIVPYAPEKWRVWPLPLTEQDRPTSRVAGSAGRIWQDVKVESPTWGDVLARHESWLDVLLGRQKAG